MNNFSWWQEKFIQNHLQLFFQLFRFGIVGLTAAAIHFSVVVFLVQTSVLQPLTANFFAFVIAFQVSYWGHYLWTFANTETLHRIALPKLLLVQVLNFIVNETLFYVLLAFHLPYQIALLYILILLPIFTFILSKFWVFESL